MGITVKTMVVAKKHPRKTFFSISFYSADIVTGEEILAAHTSKPYYIEHLIIAGDFDGYVLFGDGESGNAVETVARDFIMTNTGLPYDNEFKRPIKLTDAKSITISGIEASAGTAGPVAGIVEGFYIT